MYYQLPPFLNHMNFPFAAKFTFAIAWLCAVVLGSFLHEPLASSHAMDSIVAGSYSGKIIQHPIKVRESTTELHIQVGDRLFVFGKSKGTLDKVKIGMHVLTFAQIPGTEGLDSGFKTVSWKKLKDGSIQIQSAYSPWPATLTWTVLATGQLKMEAKGTYDFQSSSSLGLGFDLPNHELKTLNWNAKGSSTGFWNGHQDGNVTLTPFLLPGIEKVNLTFESVGLAIQSETPNLILKVSDLKDHSTAAAKSDLSFLFESSNQGISEADSPSGSIPTSPNQATELSSMILWFNFH